MSFWLRLLAIVVAFAGVSAFAATGILSGTDYVATAQPLQCVNNVHGITIGDCNLGDAHSAIDYHDYLSCLGLVAKKNNCQDAKCTKPASRLEIVGMATRIRNVRMKPNYICQNEFSDVTAKSLPGWTCQIAERALQSGIVDNVDDTFEPMKPQTRSATYEAFLRSVCVNLDASKVELATLKNSGFDLAQKKIYLAASRSGLVTQSAKNFKPNTLVTMGEYYEIAAKTIDWSSRNITCPPVTEEMCKVK